MILQLVTNNTAKVASCWFFIYYIIIVLRRRSVSVYRPINFAVALYFWWRMTRKPNISCSSELTQHKPKLKIKNIVLRRILQLAAPCNYSCILEETVKPSRHNGRRKVAKDSRKVKAFIENLENNKEIKCVF